MANRINLNTNNLIRQYFSIFFYNNRVTVTFPPIFDKKKKKKISVTTIVDRMPQNITLSHHLIKNKKYSLKNTMLDKSPIFPPIDDKYALSILLSNHMLSTIASIDPFFFLFPSPPSPSSLSSTGQRICVGRHGDGTISIHLEK